MSEPRSLMTTWTTCCGSSMSGSGQESPQPGRCRERTRWSGDDLDDR